MKKRSKIYIASPYTIGDHLENVNVQMDMYSDLLDLGYLPFAPLYSHYIHERNPKHYDIWMDVDYEWIDVCDCLLRLPGESGGADLEVKYAESKSIPVYYSVDELMQQHPIHRYDEKTKEEWYKFVHEDLRLKDEVILVENQADVLKLDKFLSKFGNPIFSHKDIREDWDNNEKGVDNDFLVKEDVGWRMQSHYIGNGTDVTTLCKKIEKYYE